MKWNQRAHGEESVVAWAKGKTTESKQRRQDTEVPQVYLAVQHDLGLLKKSFATMTHALGSLAI